MSSGTTATGRQVQRVLLIEGGGNLLALAAKIAVGLQTGSLAILSDALHSLSDVANNVIAFILLRVAMRPPDRRHPYGHRKFETIAVFGLAVLLVVIAWEIGSHAVTATVSAPAGSAWGFALMLGVLAFNLAITAWERREARRLNSAILAADASHTLADAMTSIAVIAGWQLSVRGYVWIDRLLALAIAVFVLILAVRLFLRALPALTDEAAVDARRVVAAALTVDGIRAVRRVRSRWLGDQPAIDLVIAVDDRISTASAHVIADELERLLKTRFGAVDTTVHVEPIGVD